MRTAEATRRVLLPGGFVDDAGRVHTEVELAALTGAGEEMLLNAPPDMCAAALTTELLLHTIRRLGAVRRLNADTVRQLLVQDRDYLIVRVRELTLGPDMWVRLECPRTECGQGMELNLMLSALPIERRAVAARYFVFDDAIEFRLPSGEDQEWAAAANPAGGDIGDAMLARCVRQRSTHRAIDPSALDAARRDRIEQRMRELAPDVTPELDAVCPECRTPFTAEVDMAYLVLRELKSSTRRLEEEVHLLAWHYHWPESEILAMTRQKRGRYVRLIQDQLESASLV